jgi:hypothetical protein
MSRKSLFTALCIISLFIFPHAALAKMSVLTDDQLCEVVGQAGFSIDAGSIDFNAAAGNLFWGDADGFGLLPQGGIISLSDVTLLGSINFYEPMTVSPGTSLSPFGIDIPGGVGLPRVGVGIPSCDITIGGMSIDIDQFTIGAITIGQEPGVGPSLGSFGIYDMHVNISGTIQISAR